MNVIRLKPGAGFPVLAPAGARIIAALDGICQDLKTDLVISSGSEAMGRLATDPHPLGEAVDVSVRGQSAQLIADLHAALTAKLGPLFTVLYEVPSIPSDPTLRPIAYVNAKATGVHFHIQRKRGTVYPPDPVTAPPATMQA